MEFWEQILILIFTPSAVIAAFVFFLRGFFNRALDRDLEKFKSELNRQHLEFEIKYSFIHQKKAEVIGTFYGLLVNGIKEIELLVKVPRFDDGEKLSDKRERAREVFNSMSRYFYENRIYFEEDLCEKIISLFNLLRDSFIEFKIAQPGDKIEYGSSNDPEMWKSSYKRIKEKVHPIKEELEKKFRSLLEP